MATYYIRKTGSDSNNGLAANTAWLTFGKALGATGIASGDTVYVGAGVYREVVTVNMTSATVETKVVGDVDGAQTGDSGEVQWTGYTTNDTTAPSATAVLTLNGRDFLTFENILFMSGSNNIVNGNTATSTDITFRKCTLVSGSTGTSTLTTFNTAANTAANWTYDSCIFMKGSGGAISISLTRPNTADFDYNIQIKNCLFVAGGGNSVSISSIGANAFKGGGVDMYNCSQFSRGALMNIGDTNVSTSVTCTVYNCLVFAGSPSTTIDAFTAGQIVEDYNVIYSSTPRANVTAGTNSISDGSHAPLFFTGHEHVGVGSTIRPFGMPKIDSSLARYGNQASSPTTDILGTAKPTGSVLPSIGCYEQSNSATKETSTVRTGSNAIKITGAGYQNFRVNVDSVSTTITVYTQFNASYAGTKPSMNIVNGTEAGVANATATATGSSGSWEQLSLNFTPTSSGVITVRLVSNSTATAGIAYFDDFNIS